VAISPLRLRVRRTAKEQIPAAGVRKPPPSCSRSAAPGGLWQAMASAISAHVALCWKRDGDLGLARSGRPAVDAQLGGREALRAPATGVDDGRYRSRPTPILAARPRQGALVPASGLWIQEFVCGVRSARCRASSGVRVRPCCVRGRSAAVTACLIPTSGSLGLVLCVLWEPAGGELGAPELGRLEIVGSRHRDSDDGVR
jgi:hypothetical protein